MPTILKVANVHFTQTGNNRLEYTGNGVVRLTANGIQVPVGTSATRPTGEAGIIRFNTTTGNFEGHNASGWGAIGEVNLLPVYTQANTAYNQANVSYTQANTAYNQANTAYERANTRLANGTTTLAGSLTVLGGLTTTGRVGIGTNNPSANLDVVTASGTTAGVILRNQNSSNGIMSFFTSLGQGHFNGIVQSGDKGIVFWDSVDVGNFVIAPWHNGTSGIRVSPSTIRMEGNIGIGTASPTQKLHVVGSTFSSTDMRAPSFINSNDTNARFEAGALVVRGSSPTVFFRDTDGSSAMLNNNSNFFSILRGGNDTETTAQINSQWPALFDLTNNNCTIGGNLSAIVNVIAYASDKRLKENIVEIPNALEKIRKIRGVTFDWKTEITEQHGFTPQTPTNDIGCIAQEVQAVLPHAVTLAPFDTWRPDPSTQHTPEELESKRGTSKSGEHYLTIQYERMVPLLIQAIKEQQEQIDALKAELEVLKK